MKANEKIIKRKKSRLLMYFIIYFLFKLFNTVISYSVRKMMQKNVHWELKHSVLFYFFYSIVFYSENAMNLCKFVQHIRCESNCSRLSKV